MNQLYNFSFFLAILDLNKLIKDLRAKRTAYWDETSIGKCVSECMEESSP